VAGQVGATLVIFGGRPRETLFRTRLESLASDFGCAVMVLGLERDAPSSARS
jgi:hypothetical protein